MKKNRFETPDINLVEKLTAQLMSANRELEQAYKDLHTSEQARVQAFANISHDLRAPLTAIRGALDRLARWEHLNEQERSLMISIMDRRVSALEHLIHELYFTTTIEQPEFTLQMTPIAVVPFLEEWVIVHQVDDKEFALNLDMEEDLNVFVSMDPDCMVRVLDNLLKNAEKYSAPGAPVVVICRACPSNREVLISIQDSGIGIAPEDLPHIFERSYTAAHSRTPNDDYGSGLGLYIANTIVKKHSGRISCESAPGSGSTFSIHLPIL